MQRGEVVVGRFTFVDRDDIPFHRIEGDRQQFLHALVDAIGRVANSLKQAFTTVRGPLQRRQADQSGRSLQAVEMPVDAVDHLGVWRFRQTIEILLQTIEVLLRRPEELLHYLGIDIHDGAPPQRLAWKALPARTAARAVSVCSGV